MLKSWIVEVKQNNQKIIFPVVFSMPPIPDVLSLSGSSLLAGEYE